MRRRGRARRSSARPTRSERGQRENRHGDPDSPRRSNFTRVPKAVAPVLVAVVAAVAIGWATKFGLVPDTSNPRQDAARERPVAAEPFTLDVEAGGKMCGSG